LFVIGLGGGIALFLYGFRLLRRRRLILDTPFSKIRSASVGMVEVSGLAAGPYTMVAPVTAKPCFYYRTIVWEWKQSGKSKEWVQVAAECMHVPFFVDDNTGRVLVDPRGADLDLHRDFKQEFCDSYFTTKDPVPDNVRSFLARNGIATGNKIRIEESCIKPKNALFILGTLAENPGLQVTPQPIRQNVDLTSAHSFSLTMGNSVSVSFSAGASGAKFDDVSLAERLMDEQELSQNGPTKLRVIHLSTGAGPATAADMTQQQRIAAALVKAGISSPAAWSAASVDVPAVQVNGYPPVAVVQSGEVLSDEGAGAHASSPGSAVGQESSNGFDLHPPVVLMKGTNNKTFLISWRSQQDVARALGWKSTLMIWGGPVLALLSLYVLLNLEHWL
jgi:hypothetical protein